MQAVAFSILFKKELRNSQVVRHPKRGVASTGIVRTKDRLEEETGKSANSIIASETKCRANPSSVGGMSPNVWPSRTVTALSGIITWHPSVLTHTLFG